MVADFFLAMTEYPFFRRMVWKPIYELLAKKFENPDWQFMNYGYSPSQEENPLYLDESDEPNRYPIQLYFYLTKKIDIANKSVLEVGSGRGGGLACIKKYLSPLSATGIDIARNAVNFATKQHGEKGIIFLQGNAENLPYLRPAFDVVINVESCHAYGSVPKFLDEVKRVLFPGGHFLCTDIRSPEGMEKLRTHLLESGLILIEEEDITTNVIKAIESEDELKNKRIEEQVPDWLKSNFREFAGVVGSQIHMQLKERKLVYYRFMLKKPRTF